MKRFIRVYDSGSGSVRHPAYRVYRPKKNIFTGFYTLAKRTNFKSFDGLVSCKISLKLSRILLVLIQLNFQRQLAGRIKSLCGAGRIQAPWAITTHLFVISVVFFNLSIDTTVLLF